MSLYKTHPLLFKGIILMATFKLAMGATLLFSPEDFGFRVYQEYNFAIIPRELWAVIFSLSGLLSFLGIFKPLAMRFAAALASFGFLAWAFAFIIYSLNNPFPMYALFVYFVLAGLEYASLSEPRTNPLAIKDIKWNKD